MWTNRLLSAGLLLGGAVVLTSCAEQPQQPGAPGEQPPGYVELRPMPESPGPLPDELSPHVVPPDELLEDLSLPPVTAEMMAALDEVRAAAGGSPDFGDPEISTDRTRITVRWYGPVPAAVQQVVDAHAAGDFVMVVEQVPFRPGDLQAEAQRLIREHPGVVNAVGPRPAGDGIDVMISKQAVADAGGLDQAVADAGILSEFPLFPSSGSVVPA
ncbi:hypothetical protein [Modestobacter sp. VKM Ac-2978]|uniref:hypothetical protein n=1 Tax=Modestobacter sp. VKM Ac-2978 TaxID=3004132 RepID=UPI0022AA3D99|nr:hypothetical protein [Modestobacter sp. VKM Ac-2978]MCZ2849463.1 hypothetical protein [Modestobacter sp. VKM Ac-2978]